MKINLTLTLYAYGVRRRLRARAKGVRHGQMQRLSTSAARKPAELLGGAAMIRSPAAGILNYFRPYWHVRARRCCGVLHCCPALTAGHDDGSGAAGRIRSSLSASAASTVDLTFVP
eukprot:2023307-Pleurochrysis_carterae.AAC.2